MKSIKLVAAFVLGVVLLNTGYIRAESESAGIEGWMQFSGSWRQNSLHYRSHVRKFRLLLKD